MLNTSISTLYSEFVAGSFDMTASVFDTWGLNYLAGVPVKLICGLTTADLIGIVVPGNGAKTLADLRGKTIAAPMSSGIYRMTRALVLETSGVDLETDATVQNAQNPAQGLTLLLAGRADAAVAWEPMISSAIGQAARSHDRRGHWRDVSRQIQARFADVLARGPTRGS